MMSQLSRMSVPLLLALFSPALVFSQGPDLPPLPPFVPLQTQPNVQQPAPQQPGALPNGIEVLARGPIHEAFAAPNVDPKPTQLVPKRPPQPIEEMPPEERPEGDVAWIGGYWAWDDDRGDFLWVSGCWRSKPP